MSEENKKTEQTEAGSGAERKTDVLQGLKNAFDSLKSLFRKESKTSLAQIEKRYSYLIDTHIIEKERKEKLKFSGGTFKITCNDSSYTLSMELYYKNAEDKWLKEENSSDWPLEPKF